MKKAFPIILIILIVILTGIILWQRTKPEVSKAPQTTSVQATTIVRFIATTDQANEPELKGSCWTGSIAAPFRTDAWRCTAGNELVDPCFQIAGSDKLLCLPGGSNDDNFLMSLTEALPKPVSASTAAPKNWAWKIALADGTTCTPFTGTGTLTADGRDGYYGCSDGTTLLGYLNADAPLWTTVKATLSTASKGLPTVTSSKTVSITTVWQ